MRVRLRDVLENATLAAALAALAYTAFAVARVRAFARERTAADRDDRATATAPFVTVIKPVRGQEPQLAENLRSFCEQNYPAYEVLLGVASADDPARPVLEAVAASYPERAAVVVGDGTARHRNPKIANVAPMLNRARGELLIVSDSDMRVGRDYLCDIVAACRRPGAGAATALYRGEPADARLASRLGAMGITESFAPSVLVANALGPMAYTFGSTMAVRREMLRRIGGLDALGNRLADDYALGRLVREHGGNVELARHVVANTVAETDLAALFRHEVRWARTIRAVRPAGYAGIALTHPISLALVHAALARRPLTAAVLVALAVTLRIRLHRVAHRELRSESPPPAAFVPLRDVFGFAVWLAGFGGRAVRWRGERLHIARDGTLAGVQ